MSGWKRRKSQSAPKNSKKRKIADQIPGEQSSWEALPKEIWETIFESFNDKFYGTVIFRAQPRKIQLEFLRVVSKTLNKRCKEYLERVKDDESRYDVLADVMAARGYLSCLKYLVDNGFEMTDYGLTAAIIDGPHMDVIKYAVEVLDVPWDYTTMLEVVQKDNVELLKYAFKNGGKEEINGKVAEHAARNGSIECLKFMKEIKVEWGDYILARAASSGSLECVKFLHKSRCKLNTATCAAAAEAGSLEILKYCRESGAPWDKFTIYWAAKNGHTDCVEYAIQNNAPVDTDALEAAMGHYDCLKAVHQYLGEWPGEMSWENATSDGDRVECFQYAHENGATWSAGTCADAARYGAINCLKYAHENGAAWSDNICTHAAKYGAFKCLKYAHENGAPWSEDTCETAAKHGVLNCLKYAHENGAPWSEKVCQQAASGNHLECLIYCHENGAPWDSDTAWSAARHPTVDCLKYCHEHGCPWDSMTLGVAARNSGMACLKYAAENGCPRGDNVCIIGRRFTSVRSPSANKDLVYHYLHENEVCTCKKKKK